MYISASDKTVSAMLIREEERMQLPVYFVSHALGETEKNFPVTEKVA